MNHVTDVLIIGGGVIGTSIAYNLRTLGIDVTLLERDEIGSQASSAAAGLLAPLGPLSGPGPLADLLLASFAIPSKGHHCLVDSTSLTLFPSTYPICYVNIGSRDVL